MKSKKENNILDEILQSLFEEYDVSNKSSNWTKMSRALEDAEMDVDVQNKLSEHSSVHSSQWDIMSEKLDLFNSIRRHILVKQIMEVTLALLLLLFIGQNSHFIEQFDNKNLNNKEYNTSFAQSDLKSTSINLTTNDPILSTKKDEKDGIKKLSRVDIPIFNNEVTIKNLNAQDLSSKILSSKISSDEVKNILSKKKKDLIDSDQNNDPFEQIVIEDLENDIIKDSVESNMTTPIGENQNNHTKFRIFEILKLKNSIISDLSSNNTKNKYYLPTDHFQESIKVENKKQKILLAPSIGIDINRISYPKDTFFRNKEARYTWNDTTTKSINYSYGLSIIIPKKNWILEADISMSSKISNLNKSYRFGAKIEEFTRLTLKSERFDIYSLGINLNPIFYRSPRFTAHAILGTKLNIIHRYTPEIILERIKDGLFPADYQPLPISEDEKSGNALYPDNSANSQSYSYVMIKAGVGMMYKIDTHVSIMFRSSYNYNYLNRYIGQTTARINTLNIKTGFMFNF